MIIYIDSEFKCHITNVDGTYREVETDIFNGMCDNFIEGYRFVPSGETWTRSDGVAFTGEMTAPWKNYSELEYTQHKYERELLEQYKNELAELDAAMLEMQYQSLTEGL